MHLVYANIVLSLSTCRIWLGQVRIRIALIPARSRQASLTSQAHLLCNSTASCAAASWLTGIATGYRQVGRQVAHAPFQRFHPQHTLATLQLATWFFGWGYTKLQILAEHTSTRKHNSQLVHTLRTVKHDQSLPIKCRLNNSTMHNKTNPIEERASKHHEIWSRSTVCTWKESGDS